jgi:leucyl-tRNA synthetase
VPVLFNGKLRARLTVPAASSDEALRELALGDAQVVKYLDGKTVRKVVVAGGQAAKLVSIVVS